MIRLTELKLPLKELPLPERRAADNPTETEEDRSPVPHPAAKLLDLVSRELGIELQEIRDLQVFKRSFDARKAEVLVVYIVDVDVDALLQARLLQKFKDHPHISATPDMQYHMVARANEGFGEHGEERPVVVGFGPCGMLAALTLAQMGFRPIVLERGKTVRERTKDTWALWRKKKLDPNSNVQFGEGGAGTFSDGKLYSQIRDPRFLGRKVMEEFVAAGAPADILYEAHPHIGTFRLVKVVQGIRELIEKLGGEIRFESMVVDLQMEQAECEGESEGSYALKGLLVEDLRTGKQTALSASHVIMALGHSARDTFAMLHERGVAMQAKPFSVGFRIEHPQSVIDRARWGRHAGHPMLGAADYKLVHHAKNGRTVYSFCMCPGGTVVAATSEPGRVVTNGMSQYSRNERNANAAIVAGIEPADYPIDSECFVQAFGKDKGEKFAREAANLKSQDPMAAHPLAGIALQRKLESSAFVLGGGSYEAPGQLVGDFLAGHASSKVGSVLPSYKPGVKFTDLSQSLPAYAIEAIQEALPAFGRKIKGFDMADGVLTGIETRTSSPLKIPRGEDLQCSNVRGLYPAGEGASYAGGILSAGVDGIRVAEALALKLAGRG